MPEYTVVKNRNKWTILRNGVKDDRWSWRNTKRECVAQVEKFIAADKYSAQVMEQDRTGVYVWDADEEKQIAEYAEALRVNIEVWTLGIGGKMTRQDKARMQHENERKTLEGPKDCWREPDKYFAEIRRRMAARVEAFKRAGAEL